MAFDGGDSDLETEELPSLFEDRDLRFSSAPQPQTCESSNGWSVVEEPTDDGGALRWMVCKSALSLDQTRVQLTPPDSQGHRQFIRNSLRAVSHQIMALHMFLAMDASAGSGRHSFCVMGGGGMALPMALVTHVQSAYMHVVELSDEATQTIQDVFFRIGGLLPFIFLLWSWP